MVLLQVNFNFTIPELIIEHTATLHLNYQDIVLVVEDKHINNANADVHLELGLTCLELLSESAHISSFAATLPLHLLNPFLAPHLSDAHSWKHSQSVFFTSQIWYGRSFRFPHIYACLHSLNSDSMLMRQIASSLITSDHTYSPALLVLHNISHLRTQHIFAHGVFSYLEGIALKPDSVLTNPARAMNGRNCTDIYPAPVGCDSR